MSIKRALRFNLIRAGRILLGKQFMRIFAGPLKGYLWSTSTNYDYLLGTYEDPETLKVFISWLRTGSVFYDIGANAGYYSLIAAQHIREGIIYSFEPLPRNVVIFNKHLLLNKDRIANSNIDLQAIAVSDKAGERIFSDDLQTVEGNTYIGSARSYRHADKKIIVQAVSVDAWIQQGNRPPDILKIDTEGAELDILQGAMKTLKEYKPSILLATHDCHVAGISEQCTRLLTALGYILTHTGNYNKHAPGHDDFIAIHPQRKKEQQADAK